MKLWKPRQETLWALERSLEFALLATDACGSCNQECDRIQFISLQGDSVCSMEKEIAGVRMIGERETESETEREGEGGHFFGSCITVKSPWSLPKQQVFFKQ